MEFFDSTSLYKEMALLEHIEQNKQTTQKAMSIAISSSLSMANTYLDKLENNNLIIREYLSPKIIHYHITPEGVKRKNFLSITYFHELLDLYRLAEENIECFLNKLEEKGYRNVLLYGAGEVAKTILGIINERVDKPLKVLALIDDNENRHDKNLLGYEIISREEIDKYDHDGVVISSYTFEDDIKNKLEEMNYPKNHVELFFSGM